MKRITKMSDCLVDELRQIYRERKSVIAVIRHIQTCGLEDLHHGGYYLMILEAFRLRVSQMAWMSWWFEAPEPNQDFITDEELDSKMVPEVEANRHLWDKPAAQD